VIHVSNDEEGGSQPLPTRIGSGIRHPLEFLFWISRKLNARTRLHKLPADVRISPLFSIVLDGHRASSCFPIPPSFFLTSRALSRIA